MSKLVRLPASALLAALLAVSAVEAQLPSPDLEALEPAVAEQIGSMDRFVRGRLEDISLDAGQRAESVGELGQLYHAYDLRGLAEACYLMAAELEPQDFRWPYLLGYLHQTEGRLESAARLYERALAIVPGVRPALIRLGVVYGELGRVEAAERNLSEAVRADPADAAAIAALGELYHAQGRHEKAVAALETALEIEPDANRLYYPLAMARRALGEEEEARQLLQRAGKVGVKPGDPLVDGLARLTTGERVHVLRGRAAYAAGRYDEAVEEFRRALAANEESISARVNLGSALAARGDQQAAIDEFQRAVELAPANLAALYNLGSLTTAAGDLEGGLAWFREAVSYNPEDLPSRIRLAQSLIATGRPETALPHFRKVLAADPDNEDAWLGEASALVRLDRYLEALGRLEAARARLPSSGQIAHALARMLSSCPRAELRDGPRAVTLAERVFAARPTPGHGSTLAEALGEAGRCEEAAALTEQLLGQLRREDLGGWVPRLEAALALYRGGPPCRPPLESLEPAPDDR